MSNLNGHKYQRPDWDHYFMQIADIVASRGSCERLQVGCVIVRDKRILVTGYNGAAKGAEHCTDPGVGCLMVDGHCQRAVHAETNAVIQGALHGVSLAGATVYVTHSPCRNCAKLLVGTGIVRVVYRKDYADKVTQWWADNHDVRFEEISEPTF